MSFAGMIVSSGGKTYVTGCNFKNKLDSFDLHDGAELHFTNCDFTNNGNIGTASESIIYGPKEFKSRFATDEKYENNYYCNDLRIGNVTFNPEMLLYVEVSHLNNISRLNDFISNYTPSNLFKYFM